MYGDELNDEDFEAQVEAVQREIEELELENGMIDSFLKRNQEQVAQEQAAAKEQERQRSQVHYDSVIHSEWL